jgi:hypothetical protein
MIAIRLATFVASSCYRRRSVVWHRARGKTPLRLSLKDKFAAFANFDYPLFVEYHTPNIVSLIR